MLESIFVRIRNFVEFEKILDCKLLQQYKKKLL